MLRSGRLVKRFGILLGYTYYFVLEKISPRLSLERPKVRLENQVVAPEGRDQSSSIELHLVTDENARKKFDQPDARRQAAVTAIPDKFRTGTCFTCDSPLTPVVQVVNADDARDYIEMAWCGTCDSLQYSVMPSKDWISNWYATNWDSGGTISDKLENRRTTYRYLHRLTPFIGNRKLRVLDIGAGYGEKIRPFALAGHEVHCTEATPRRAEYLREYVTKNVYLGTLDNPAVRDALRKNGPFDLIFSYHVIEHIYGAKTELQILRDIAADDAVFYLAIPELYKEGLLSNIYSLEHISSFSRLGAKTLLKQAGFRCIVDKDDLFQYYSNYCQYVIGRKAAAGEDIVVHSNHDGGKMVRFLADALSLDRVAAMEGAGCSYTYHGCPKLTYAISAESKAKCRNPVNHLPIRIYHYGLPLFWMQS